ncbi:MAG: tetratricopeptide repeat protein [Nitrospinota bacterium]|nr:tetratricopeptide repeat protein [Nitrospinota bacterium]
MRTLTCFTALCVLCSCAPDAERIEKQIEQYQARIAVDPNNVEIYYQLGHAHLTLGRYEQGASHLKDAVRLSKKHALAHRDLGWALYQLKEYRAAEPWLLKALEMKPRNRATLSTLSAVYIGQKRYREVVDLLKPFVDTGRGTVPIHNNLATAYRHLGSYPLAIEQVQQALKKKPNSAGSHNNLGVLLEKTGQAEQALAEYRIALTLDPGYGSAHFNLAVALTRQGKIEEALNHFRIAQQAYPDDPEILAGLGWTYHKLNRYLVAISYYKESARLAPSNLQVQQALGELWDITQHYDRAIDAYEAAIGLDPEEPDNYFHLGRLNDHFKAGEKAVAYMALAEELYRKKRNAEMAAHCRKNISIMAGKYHFKREQLHHLTRPRQSLAG